MDFIENNKAIFIQIADHICDQIITSVIGPDERIPSVRALAATLEVNANTVMRAYEYLASRGILYNKRGIGFFATPDAPRIVAEKRKTEFVENELIDTFRRLHILNISPDALKDMYSSYLSNNS